MYKMGENCDFLSLLFTPMVTYHKNIQEKKNEENHIVGYGRSNCYVGNCFL